MHQQAKIHGEQIQQLLTIQQNQQEQEQVGEPLREEHSTEGAYDWFRRMNPLAFAGSSNPSVAED